jgi:hypothetical protein
MGHILGAIIMASVRQKGGPCIYTDLEVEINFRFSFTLSRHLRHSTDADLIKYAEKLSSNSIQLKFAVWEIKLLKDR